MPQRLASPPAIRQPGSRSAERAPPTAQATPAPLTHRSPATTWCRMRRATFATSLQVELSARSSARSHVPKARATTVVPATLTTPPSAALPRTTVPLSAHPARPACLSRARTIPTSAATTYPQRTSRVARPRPIWGFAPRLRSAQRYAEPAPARLAEPRAGTTQQGPESPSAWQRMHRATQSRSTVRPTARSRPAPCKSARQTRM